MTAFENLDLTKPLELPEQGSWPATSHRFDEESVWALRAAVASRRPLLLRGEPGIGKSQLARAAAVALKVPFLYHVVDERSERDDLLYKYDAVARLAEAQVSAWIAKEDPKWREKLAERNFIRPGVLWWAFHWDSAQEQAARFQKASQRQCQEPEKGDWSPQAKRPCGPVVLVDEIDKADPSVPNGLLESLGNEGFHTEQLGEAIRTPDGVPAPLIIITTNEERELPAAFLRRCLVLHLAFPTEAAKATNFLLERARVHTPARKVSDPLCREVSEVLLADRAEAARRGLPKPGAAEYLDIVRVLAELHPGQDAAQRDCLRRIASFALKKNAPDTP